MNDSIFAITWDVILPDADYQNNVMLHCTSRHQRSTVMDSFGDISFHRAAFVLTLPQIAWLPLHWFCCKTASFIQHSLATISLQVLYERLLTPFAQPFVSSQNVFFLHYYSRAKRWWNIAQKGMGSLLHISTCQILYIIGIWLILSTLITHFDCIVKLCKSSYNEQINHISTLNYHKLILTISKYKEYIQYEFNSFIVTWQ